MWSVMMGIAIVGFAVVAIRIRKETRAMWDEWQRW